MDLSAKKRKSDENGNTTADTTSPNPNLTIEDVRKIIEPFTEDQLREILPSAVLRHIDVLDAVRAIGDQDLSQRKLFIRGLSNETTTDNLRAIFSTYGELAEAIVILDKITSKSKGFGFITFKHIDGAILALKEPSKLIDGRMTVTQLASLGNVNLNPTTDMAMRKIYVWNVPFDMPGNKLLMHFATYGEIEEGPLGFDKATGKSKGFAFFVYKNAEGAKAALEDPTKIIDEHQVLCKLAIDGKKNENANPIAGGVQVPSSTPASLTSQFAPPGGLSSQFGVPSGLSPYGAHQLPLGLMAHHHHFNSSIGAPGLSSVGAGMPSSLGGGYGGYSGLTAGGYSGFGSAIGRLPPSSVGLPSSAYGGYPEGGHYSLTSGQPHQHLGTSSAVPRLPVTGYPGVPPYY